MAIAHFSASFITAGRSPVAAAAYRHRTEMTDRTIANIAARTNRTAADAERTLASASALGRLLEPEEVAAAVAFLCTEDARAINGQSLVLDGGTIQS